MCPFKQLLSELENLDDYELEDLQDAIKEEQSNRGEARFTAKFDWWDRTAVND